jgi:uncharacterized low-complexity protein
LYKILVLTTLFSLSGCDFKKVEEGKAPKQSAMKCGAGKCGASMIDDSSVLKKKKTNILAQMRSDDTRKECVKFATSTKNMYNCLRNKDTKRLTKKCAADTKSGASMKCGAGKCGAMKINTH